MKDNKIIRNVIDNLISEKILKDENCITFSYYEVIVKNDLKQEQQEEFKQLSKIKLNNMGYTVYFENDEFMYDGARRKVQCNEILIAIKNIK